MNAETRDRRQNQRRASLITVQALTEKETRTVQKTRVSPSAFLCPVGSLVCLFALHRTLLLSSHTSQEVWMQILASASVTHVRSLCSGCVSLACLSCARRPQPPRFDPCVPLTLGAHAVDRRPTPTHGGLEQHGGLHIEMTDDASPLNGPRRLGIGLLSMSARLRQPRSSIAAGSWNTVAAHVPSGESARGVSGWRGSRAKCGCCFHFRWRSVSQNMSSCVT